MTEKQLTEVALQYILQSDDMFGRIKKDIDDFLKKYNVDWLPASQVGTIQEILLSENEKTILERLHQYKELQLKRVSEKDKWRRESDGVIAIDCFFDMVKSLAEKHHSFIKEKLEADFRLMVNDEYREDIFKNLLSVFTHIFVTTLRSEQRRTENV